MTAGDGRDRPDSRLGALGEIVAIMIAVLAGGAALAREKPIKPDTSRSDVEAVEVVARRLSGFDKLNPSRTSFGQLEWVGGLVLTSGDERFGGWSGLAVEADGRRLLAVSDAGTWMTADLVYRDGRPRGLANARLGPLKARSGVRLKRDRDRDAEAVLLRRGTLERGQLLIGFEQNHRLGLFGISSSGVAPPSAYLKLPAESRRMRALKGFEAVAELQAGRYKGAFLSFAEHLLDRSGHHSGWIISGGRSWRLALIDLGGFDPTDAVGLANGDIIVLERRFRWTEGVKMRLRRVRVAEIKPGAVIKGEVLLEADMSDEIDNMEALSAHRDRDGRIILTIMSDDNFNSFLQRNLLLQFRLKDNGAQRASQ